MSSSRLKVQKYLIIFNLINGNSLKKKHCNGYYLYKLLWCVILIMTKDLNFQRELVKKLKSGEKNSYEDASIYTILFDLLEGNGLDEVFMMLHNVATDLEQRKALEDKFDEAKKWQWT